MNKTKPGPAKTGPAKLGSAKRWSKRLLWAAGICTAAVLILFGILQTPWVKASLAQFASESVSGALQQDVSIKGLSGLLPFNAAVENVAIAGGEGPWLDARGIALDWSPLNLLRGKVFVSLVRAESVRLERLPPAAPEEPEDTGPWQPPKLPSLPKWLTVDSVQVGELRLGEPVMGKAASFRIEGHYRAGADDLVTELHINGINDTDATVHAQGQLTADGFELSIQGRDAALLPELLRAEPPLTLALEGQGPMENWTGTLRGDLTESPWVNTQFKVDATEGYRVKLDGSLGLDHAAVPEGALAALGDEPALQIDAALSPQGMLDVSTCTIEVKNGSLVVAGTLDIPRAHLDSKLSLDHADINQLFPEYALEKEVPLQLTIRAEGPLRDIETMLAGELAGAEVLRGNLRVKRDPGFEADGSLHLAAIQGVLPPDIEVKLADGADIEVQVRYTPKGILTIQPLRLHTAQASLLIEGEAHPAQGRMAFNGDLTVDDFSAFNPISPYALAGSANVTAQVSGDETGTQGELQLAMSEFEAGQTRIQDGNLPITFQAGAWPKDLAKDIELEAGGTLNGVDYGAGDTRDVNIELAASSPDSEAIQVKKLEIIDGNASLSAQGSLRLRELKGDFVATVEAARLEEYAGLFGQPYGGQITLEAQLAEAEDSADTLATLEGAWTNPSGLPEHAGAIMGDELTVNGRANLSRERVAVERVDLQGLHLTMGATGTYQWDGTLDAEANLEAPRLAVLSDSLGGASSGSVRMKAQAAGQLDQLRATGDMQLASVRAPGFRSDSGAIEVQVDRTSESISGNLRGELRQDAAELTANGSFRMESAALVLESLQVANGPNSMQVQGRFDHEALRGQGTLDLTFPELAALQPFFPVAPAGSVRANAQLADTGDSMDFQGQALLESFHVGDLSIEQGQMDWDVKDLADSPRGQWRATMSQLKSPGIEVAAFDMQAEGERSRIEFSGTTDARLNQVTPVTNQFAGRISFADGSLEQGAAQLAEFAGTLGRANYALTGSAPVSWESQGINAGPLEIEFGEGRIQAEGSYTPEQIRVSGSWSDLPLSALEALNGTLIEGTANGTVQVAGNPGAPNGTLEADVAGLRFPSNAAEGAPPVRAAATLQIGGGKLLAELTADAEEAVQVFGSAALPVRFQITPFRLQVEPEANLNGNVDASADLAAIPEIFGLEEHLLSGTFTGELQLEGSPTNPLVHGAAQLENGRYENTVTGTILEDMTAVLNADGDTVQLAQFEATDGQKGSFSANGELRLSPAEAFPFSAATETAAARLAHRDDISLQAGSKLNIQGDLETVEVTGTARIGPASITIPERLPASEIQTVEFTMRGEQQSDTGESQVDDTPPPMRINLDIACDIPGRVFVRGPGLASEWEGKLHVLGTTQAPRIDGTLRVTSGNLNFLGRRFNFAESTISFDRDLPPSPYLNVTAVTDTADATARMQLTGDFNALELSLDSDPPMPRDEILAQVLFGQDLADISPLQAVQLARYAPLFTGKFKGLRLLGGSGATSIVDRLNVRRDPGVGGTTVTAGKYFSDRIYMEIQQGTAAGSGKVSAEFEISPQWNIKGESAPAAGKTGLGFFWEKDY